MNTLSLVKTWHKKFDVPVKDSPNILNESLNDLRVNLIQEELTELWEALQNEDEVEVLDALTDLQYVLDGAYLSLGFHKYKNEAFKEVHRSNMSKLDENGNVIRREDGKILKPDTYSLPKLKDILQ